MLGLQAENSKLSVILGLWVEKRIDYSYTLGLQADKFAIHKSQIIYGWFPRGAARQHRSQITP